MIALKQSKSSPESSRLIFINVPAAQASMSFECAVLAGLQSSPRTLPCRLFYDRRGSELFEQICSLPEYYLTRAEQSILERHSAEIVTAAGTDLALVEFGSGSSRKTRLLIEELLRRTNSLHYLPIDISCDFLQDSAHELLNAYPGLRITAIAGEYRDSIAALLHIDEGGHNGSRDIGHSGDGHSGAGHSGDGHSGDDHDRYGYAVRASRHSRLILFLGSNIGNFEKQEAVEFLSAIRSTMNDDDRMLLGFDLLKRRETLHAAYNDSQGVTSEFNKNLLVRINEELDADFDLDAFEHSAPFVEKYSRIEMHLVSRVRQTVRIASAGISIEFQEGETIHTENSHKYSYSAIQEVAGESALEIAGSWFDSSDLFAVLLLKPSA